MFFSHLKNKMAACQKSPGGVFSKNFRPGGYTKNTPLPPIPVAWLLSY